MNDKDQNEESTLSSEMHLYSDLAWTWSIISPPDDYIEETKLYCKVIREFSKIPVETILHLGCGGGHNDYTLKRYFRVTGIDTSEAMLELARKLNPQVTYHLGDMRRVRLGNTFDAVTIFDSINHMTSMEDLRAAFRTAFSHLKPGGVFLTLAEDTLGRFKQNKTTFETKRKGDVEITFVENHYDPNPRDTSYEATFVYLIRRRGNLKICTDRHLCGLFSLRTWLDFLRDEGFKVKQLKFEHSEIPKGEHYPMWVCVKP